MIASRPGVEVAMTQRLSHSSSSVPARPSPGTKAFMEVVGVDQLIREHEPAFRKLRHDLGFDDREFQQLRPLLEHYITWVHCLPASQGVYAGRGGLLQQGLDGAFWAGRGSRSQVFDSYDLTPREKHENKPRWLMASVVGGLLYGTEEALQRLVVTDSQDRTWDYRSVSLTDWLARQGIRRFFYVWRNPSASPRRVLVDQLLPRPLLEALGRPIADTLRRVLHGEAIEPLASLLETVYQENRRQPEVRTVPAGAMQRASAGYSPLHWLALPDGFDGAYLRARLQRSHPSPADGLNRWFRRWLNRRVMSHPVPGVPVVRVRAWRGWMGWLPRPVPVKVELHRGYVPLDQLPWLPTLAWQVRPGTAGSLDASTAWTRMRLPMGSRVAKLVPDCLWQVFFHDRRVGRHRDRPPSSKPVYVVYRPEPGDYRDPMACPVERVRCLSEAQMDAFWETRRRQRQARRQGAALDQCPASRPAPLVGSPPAWTEPPPPVEPPGTLADDRRLPTGNRREQTFR